jgi:surfeit locus 1 family protein
VPNPVSSIIRQWRFRPGLWPTVAAAGVIATTILLGNWQGRRAEIRGAMQAQSADVGQQAPLRIIRAGDITPDLRYHRVAAEGQYLAEHQIWLDNRTYHGAAGFYVLTPLRLDGGGHVLVNRGWIAATPQHTAPPAAPPPGRVTVTGRLNQSPPSFLALQHVTPSGPVWQNLDLVELAQVSGLAFAPLVVEQEGGSTDGLVRDWPAPDSGREKNVSYMWQWYSFAALTAALWLILNWQRREGGGNEQ